LGITGNYGDAISIELRGRNYGDAISIVGISTL
jgi:hypothetical protein